jgi:outer membrane lipoprotein SlyB
MKSIVIIITLCLLIGCAGHRPIIDQKNVDMNSYESDVRECQTYADMLSPGKTAIIGGVIGGAIGATVGAVIGLALHDSKLAGELMVMGAAIGGMKGAIEGGAVSGMSQVQIINECMEGRGYRVLLKR